MGQESWGGCKLCTVRLSEEQKRMLAGLFRWGMVRCVSGENEAIKSRLATIVT